MRYFYLLMLTFFCFLSCTTLHYKGGEKERSVFMPKDHAKRYKNSFDFHDFEIANFGQKVKQDSLKPYAEYFTPNAINELRKRNEKTFILLWNPGCIASKKKFQFAQKLDSLNITVAIVAVKYHLPSIINNLKNSRFQNNPIYILEPINEKSTKVQLKIRSFVREVCPRCYVQNMDGLSYTNALIITKDSTEIFTRFDEQKIEQRLLK